MNTKEQPSRTKKLIPVAAALAFAAAGTARTIGSRGLPTEVVVASKRVAQRPEGAAYLMSFADGRTLHDDLRVSETAWDAFQIGDRLPARRALGGRLYTIEMRYAR